MENTDSKTMPMLITEQEMFKLVLGKVPPYSRIIRLRNEGELPAYVKISQRYFYRLEAILEWIRQKETA